MTIPQKYSHPPSSKTPANPGLTDAFETERMLHIGDVHASAEPLVLSTILGSCIAACLYDPMSQIGGMNHFLLPQGRGDGRDPDAARFGVYAMDRLIGCLIKLGADRRRLLAKVFGGGHVLTVSQSSDVAGKNISFVREFLACEGIPLMNEDVGGTQPRHVRFYTATGQVFVKRLPVSAHPLEREQDARTQPPTYGKVVLFDPE